MFVGALAVEHVLEPQLDPARHMVSEYARTSSGALMTIGFIAWALALASTARRAWRSSPALGLLLVVAAAGVVCLTMFRTQTSAGVLPPGSARTLGGRLHDVGSGTATAALLVGAVVAAASPRFTRRLRQVSTSAVAAALLLNTVLLTVGDSVGGLRQRVLLIVGVVWQSALLAEP